MAIRDSNYSHLRSWTLYHLNEKTYSDLTWCDQEKKTFKLSWKKGAAGTPAVVAYCAQRGLQVGIDGNVFECKRRFLRGLRENAGFQECEHGVVRTHGGGWTAFRVKPLMDSGCFACILDENSEGIINYLEQVCGIGLEPGMPLPAPLPTLVPPTRSAYARAHRLGVPEAPLPHQIVPFWRLRIQVFYFGVLALDHTSQDRRGVRLHPRPVPRPGHLCFYGTGFTVWFPSPDPGKLTPDQITQINTMLVTYNEGIYVHGNETGVYVDNRNRETLYAAGNDCNGDIIQREVMFLSKQQIFYFMGFMRKLARSPVPESHAPCNGATLYLSQQPGAQESPQVPISVVVCQDELVQGQMNPSRWCA
ncbi:JM104 [macacine gammaherpesvirus 11]|uniref:JM104 n=2 Tax=macacine gammaherpesvirus 11 TaxID=2560570 RepID=G9JMT2_9GAMA|nr:JM104 [Macaca fuscata rhadinovirus]AAT00081.1 JM104 [Macaca fuscata rhadinovirus]AEW87629.1 JM104 [Macaca fuscata rhadinovirus]AEW87799.1 JM104 [Macaca fuscata rhadinovirus]